jgi:hypothetical protein
MWGMANGNASVFSQMGGSGLRPRSIDGTIGVTDRVTIIVRMTMADSAQAASIAKEIDQVKAMAAAYVERVDVRVVGPMTQIEVVVTEAQLRALAGMAGALIGS